MTQQIFKITLVRNGLKNSTRIHFKQKSILLISIFKFSLLGKLLTGSLIDFELHESRRNRLVYLVKCKTKLTERVTYHFKARQTLGLLLVVVLTEIWSIFIKDRVLFWRITFLNQQEHKLNLNIFRIGFPVERAKYTSPISQ